MSSTPPMTGCERQADHAGSSKSANTGCHSRRRVYPAAVNLPLAQLPVTALPDRRDRKCRFTRWCRKEALLIGSTAMAGLSPRNCATRGLQRRAWSGTRERHLSHWRAAYHMVFVRSSTVVHGVAVPRGSMWGPGRSASAGNGGQRPAGQSAVWVAERSSADVCHSPSLDRSHNKRRSPSAPGKSTTGYCSPLGFAVLPQINHNSVSPPDPVPPGRPRTWFSGVGPAFGEPRPMRAFGESLSWPGIPFSFESVELRRPDTAAA